MTHEFKRSLANTAIAASVLIVLFSFKQARQWYMYESKEMGFKIRFPQKPQETSQDVNSAIGKLKLTIVMCDASLDASSSNIAYAVNYTGYPDSLVNSNLTEKLPAIFRGALDGAAKNVQGKIISEKIISFKNYPGREAKITMRDQGIITCRCILVQNKMYVLMAVSAINKDTNADITKFLDSFDLE